MNEEKENRTKREFVKRLKSIGMSQTDFCKIYGKKLTSFSYFRLDSVIPEHYFRFLEILMKNAFLEAKVVELERK
ncbi:hypothetical protein, partial [Campylobacter fetus]